MSQKLSRLQSLLGLQQDIWKRRKRVVDKPSVATRGMLMTNSEAKKHGLASMKQANIVTTHHRVHLLIPFMLYLSDTDHKYYAASRGTSRFSTEKSQEQKSLGASRDEGRHHDEGTDSDMG